MNSSELHGGLRARTAAAPTLQRALTRAFARGSFVLGLLLLALLGPAPTAVAQVPPDTTLYRFIKDVRFGAGASLCPGEPVIMHVSGSMPNCMRFAGLRILPTAGPFLVVAARVVDFTCVADCLPGTTDFSASIDLGPASPGQYLVVLAEEKSGCPDTTQTAEFRSLNQAYVVRPECPPPPPGLDSLLRSFTSLRVLPAQPCVTDTVRLSLALNGCPPCAHLTSFSFTRVRGLVATMDWTPLCAELRCGAESLSVSLGPLAAGFHRITVATDVNVRGTNKPDSTISFVRVVEFAVAARCDTLSQGCVDGVLPPFGLVLPQCAARIRPGSSGEAVLPIRTAVPAAGIEGFLASVAPFQVTNIAYAGTAAGVQVSWRRDGPLTRFVVFGTRGVAVPAGVSSLLRVTLAADSSLTAGPESGRLQGVVTLASDGAGEAIPFCALPAVLPPALNICLDRSAPSGCDVNGDGHTDVRDLVRMATCLRAPVAGDPRCHDCDGDSTFGIPDLICCAREVLGGGGVPGDSAVVNSGLVVSIDPPVAEGSGVRLRVRVRGAAALDAALLRLRYPAERWQLSAAADLEAGFAQGWLPLVEGAVPQREAAGSSLSVGALRLGEGAAGELVFDLHAEPLAPASGFDALIVEGADLTSGTGQLFAPSVALPRVELAPLTPPAVTELSPPRPNPFGRSTSFSVTLPREATVELSVHDVTGRMVARLAQGRLAAGQRTFTWDANGARDGVYFVRLTVDGQVRSTRVALLRDGH
ncbi:MAG: T9SS type A sorting domain-containing protein [Candidatus Eisenbacteria bacterium]